MPEVFLENVVSFSEWMELLLDRAILSIAEAVLVSVLFVADFTVPSDGLWLELDAIGDRVDKLLDVFDEAH